MNPSSTVTHGCLAVTVLDLYLARTDRYLQMIAMTSNGENYKMKKLLIALTLSIGLMLPVHAGHPAQQILPLPFPNLNNNDRVIFAGDSISEQGIYSTQSE